MFSICIYHSCVNCTKWKFIKNNINKRCFYFGDVLLKVVPMDSLLVLYDFLIGKIVLFLRIIEIDILKYIYNNQFHGIERNIHIFETKYVILLYMKRMHQ